MRESFRLELIDSGYLHMLLKLPLERSTEASSWQSR